MKCAKCEETLAPQTGIGFQYNVVHALVCRPCNVKLWQWIQRQDEWQELLAIDCRKTITKQGQCSYNATQEEFENKMSYLINSVAKLERDYANKQLDFIDKVLEQLPSFGQEYSEFE